MNPKKLKNRNVKAEERAPLQKEELKRPLNINLKHLFFIEKETIKNLNFEIRGVSNENFTQKLKCKYRDKNVQKIQR